MKLLVLDGNSILNRAFYGIKLLTTKNGAFTNGIFGFMNILFSLRENYAPDAVAIAFDVSAPTFRHKMYSDYKGNRKGMPPELKSQVQPLKELLTALGYKLIESEGWEADDVIGTLAKSCREGDECLIATGDRDSLQLVDENTVVLLSAPKAGKTETVVYDREKILADKGIEPVKLIEVKALMGDASDNIPGVAGIGEKTALSLIKEYSSIDSIYEKLDSLELTPSVRKKLESGRESAYLSRELGTIRTDAPIDALYSSYVPAQADKQRAKAILTELEMNKFIEKLDLRDVVLLSAERKTDSYEVSEMSAQELFAALGDRLYFIADDNFEKAYVSLEGKICAVAFKELTAVLADGEVKIYTHDAKRLYSYAEENEIQINGLEFDTMLAGYLLNPNASDYDLHTLADSYSVFANIDSEDELIKCAAVLKPLCDALETEIENNSEARLLHEIEIPLARVLASMEHYGFRVDFAGIHEYGLVLDKKLAELIERIYSYAGEFNVNSTKQLAVVLFEKLGLPVKKKTKTGYSTNAKVLEELYDEHPIIPEILEYRTIQKLKSTYCDSLLKVVGEDSRIHSTFRQTETRTGRLSSTEPNLQNIPVRQEIGRNLRKYFTSEDGWTLIDADYSQIELRVLAAVADDKNMIESFNNGEDIHAITASQVFNMPLEMVTPLMRSRAKAVNFGIVYGIGAFSLGRDIGVPVYEAKRYIDSYLAHYSSVAEYMEKTVERAKSDGYVKTLFNRRRYLPELKSSNAVQRAFGERVARNMPIQGTAADIIKIAMVKVFERLKAEKLRSRLIMQVHDELIIEAPLDECERAKEILVEEMENAVSLSVKLSVDAHIGKTWYEAKG